MLEIAMIDDISDAVGELHQDCIQAGQNIEKDDTPFNRRTYVRTFFSALEASIHFMRQIALATLAKHPGLFDKEEIEMLEEKRRLRLTDSIAFVCEMYSRAMYSPFKLVRSGEKWDAFLTAIKVRDSITHPKRRASLDISNQNLHAVQAAYQFVVGAMIESLAQGSEKVEREVREMLEKHTSSISPEPQ
jgi:hypothetical protein